ncbi:hypothetical protein EXIGLDRAFT_568138, partial [Exidia glandulosa HHB12029]
LEKLSLLATESVKLMDEAGSPAAWQMLAQAEQIALQEALRKQLAIKCGEMAFQQLMPKEHHMIDFFVWGGCCMHKDLNTVKGSNTGLQQYW